MNLDAIEAELSAVEGVDLRWNPATKTHDEVTVNPTVFRQGNTLCVSAEDGKPFADYYAEFSGGYPWISKALEAFASKHGCFWEWINPACIGLYPR